MVQLICSPKVREKLASELAAAGIPIDDDGEWVLVEHGLELPQGKPAIVFDPLDYIQVVRLLVSGLREEGGTRRLLTGQIGTTFSVFAPRDVAYFEAVADGIVACTATGRYRVRQTLAHYETTLASMGFVRINKSQLANIVHVKEIVPWFNSRYVLRLVGGDELEVSKTYAKRLRSALSM